MQSWFAENETAARRCGKRELALQNQRVLAATRRKAAFDLTLTGSDRSQPEGNNCRPG
jgi:hypothetical protein